MSTVEAEMKWVVPVVMAALAVMEAMVKVYSGLFDDYHVYLPCI